jgi:hypothetical protein
MATYKSIRYIIPAEAVEHTDSINALNDVDTVTTAPTNGQVLKWNSTNSKWYPGDVEEESGLTTTLGIVVAGWDDMSWYSVNSNVLISNTGTISSVSYTNADELGLGDGATYGGDKGILIGSGFSTAYNMNSTSGTATAQKNLVSNAGVVGSTVTITTDAISGFFFDDGRLSGLTYGGDKCIFGWGVIVKGSSKPNRYLEVQKSFLVSNTGVIGSDVSLTTDSHREGCIGTGYGGDKGIVIYGRGVSAITYNAVSNNTNITYTNLDGRANLISNTGVVASETACAGTRRNAGAGGEYGGDKAITAYGNGSSSYSSDTNQINTISNTGVVSSDTTGVGTARRNMTYTRYGTDKGIFFSGSDYNMSTYQVYNLVSNTGVVATDTSTTIDGRGLSLSCGYGS